MSISKVPKKESDYDYINNNPLAPQWSIENFRLFIAGRSGSGKTMMLLNLIWYYLYYDTITIYAKNIEQDTYQTLIEKLNEVGEKKNIQGFLHVGRTIQDIKPIEDYNPQFQNLIIFDDFLTDKKANHLINDYFIRSRHRNCSVIYLSQLYYKANDDSLSEIRKNCNYFALFKGLKSSLPSMYGELGGMLDKDTFYDMYSECTKKDYGFMVVDLKTSNSMLMFRDGWDGLFINSHKFD